MQLYYNWNNKLINEQNNAILMEIYSKNFEKHPVQLYDFSSWHLALCHESTYFTKITDQFENYLVEKFNNLVKNIKEQQQQGIFGDYSEFINISEIINHLDFSKIKNYKNFHTFLNVLKEAYGQLEIRIDVKSNYYQAPEEFTTEPIRILDRDADNLFDATLDKAGKQYQQFIYAKTQKSLTLNKKYQEIKKQLINVPNWRYYCYFRSIFYSKKRKI